MTTASRRTTLAILHPGAMGARVGAAARAGGHRVVWVDKGRSSTTRGRAEACDLESVATLAEALEIAGIVVSVCPPHAAVDVAQEVSEHGFLGLYVDANAIAPQTTRSVAAVVRRSGARFVDGGIIGPPPRREGSTRLYLSSEDDGAAQVAACFVESPLDAIVIEGGDGGASALKMCYAAYTKGRAAMIAAVVALAFEEEVLDPLLDEWRLSQPRLADSFERILRSVAPKAWRFRGEMEEIAATFRASDLPPDFHEGAAEIYRRLAGYKGAEVEELTLDQIVAALQEDHGDS